MTPTVQAVKTGIVGAYMTSGDADAVRSVRAQTGRVTLSGKSGLATLRALERDDDLTGVDLDPATYMGTDTLQGQLFGINWIGEQRDLGLDVIRSEGRYAQRKDLDSLRSAFAGRLPAGVSRVVSLSDYWLQPGNVGYVLGAVRNCDEPLTLILGALFDPLDTTAAVYGLKSILDAASPTERRVELLRTDTHGLGFALLGGAQAAIGLSASGRHHPQPMNRRTKADFDKRQRSTAVWVPALMSWQQGVKLDALRPFGGAGVTTCACEPCDGESLLRFTQEWTSVPKAVSADARAHDVASWLRLRDHILNASDPRVAWARACAAAERVETDLISNYKVSALKVRSSLRAWTT